MHVLAAGTLFGWAYASARKQPVRAFAWSTGTNATIIGLVFFATREYAISPALVALVPTAQYLRRRETLSSLSSASTPLTWRQMRTEKLLDSALAGAGAAAMASAIRGGRSAAFGPAALVGALFSSFVQYGANEVHIARVKLVSAREQHEHDTRDQPVVPILERVKDTLGVLVPIDRGPDSDARELARLKREKDEADAKLAAVRAKLEEAEKGEKDS
ncbi:hypothetical protein AURDEDRAFT_185209 [Auricularia subglabra TFB-10046 SS5]|nr:hypothetical protein AURDEDRAFT_185209 [Auricularia subglabra TFB-10046 SS5]